MKSVALAGTAEQCVARLKELCALDLDRITFALLSGGRKRRMEQLATEIIPAVNA